MGSMRHIVFLLVLAVVFQKGSTIGTVENLQVVNLAAECDFSKYDKWAGNDKHYFRPTTWTSCNNHYWRCYNNYLEDSELYDSWQNYYHRVEDDGAWCWHGDKWSEWHYCDEYDWEFHFKNGEKRRYRHNQQTDARSYEEARKYCKQHYGEEYDLAGFNATFVVVDNKVQQARYREEYEDNVEKIKKISHPIWQSKAGFWFRNEFAHEKSCLYYENRQWDGRYEKEDSGYKKPLGWNNQYRSRAYLNEAELRTTVQGVDCNAKRAFVCETVIE